MTSGNNVEGKISVGLVNRLGNEQIDAACRLYDRLPEWHSANRALEQLADRFPLFDFESCLLKTVTLNSLYSTMVFATLRMAEHIHQVLKQADSLTAGPELVERIAALPERDGGGVKRRFRSFASKFAHFFIDSNRFPIFDSYAVQMIDHHRGCSRGNDPTRAYVAFASNFATVKKRAGADDRPNQDLDRYLWLSGQYWTLLRKPETRISTEVQAILTSKEPQIRRLVQRMISDEEREGLQRGLNPQD